jgi:hypothetical protein
MSDDLHQAFRAWVIEFENAPVDEMSTGYVLLDWTSFHHRGLGLARRLRGELGDDFVIMYRKPQEDPEYQVDHCRVVHADGRLTPHDGA